VLYPAMPTHEPRLQNSRTRSLPIMINLILSKPIMSKSLNISLTLAVLCTAFALAPVKAQPAENAPLWHADLAKIRQMARMIPGPLPLRVNVIKFAESRRPKNFAVKGLPAEPSVQARTAYQVVYADGTIMVDTGMDLATHRFFGRGAEEPYFPEAEARVASALKKRERSSSPMSMATTSQA
jgi:hypothetical protein